MDWKEMHIGLDLGLQMLNSNLFGKLEKEGKDLLINRTILDLVSKEVNADRQTVTNIESYGDIKQFSSLIAPLLKIKKLKKIEGESNYDYGILPKDRTSINSGHLQHGREYRVITPGTTNLSGFGGTTTPINGQVFTCNMSVRGVNTLKIGGVYKIVTTGDTNFKLAGAINSMVGTEFVSTLTNPGGTGTVQPLSEEPTWAGNTTLEFTVIEDVYEEIASISNVDTGMPFASGELRKGEKYKVITGGTIVGLTVFGSIADKIEEGYIFKCTQSGPINWGNSGVSLITTKDVLNRMVKVQDVYNFLQNSYGTVTSSPIAAMVEDKLLVYHDSKFNINEITLTYLRAPRKVSSQTNTDCDLALKFHNSIVDNAIAYAMSISNNPAYPAFSNEKKTDK